MFTPPNGLTSFSYVWNWDDTALSSLVISTPSGPFISQGSSVEPGSVVSVRLPHSWLFPFFPVTVSLILSFFYKNICGWEKHTFFSPYPRPRDNLSYHAPSTIGMNFLGVNKVDCQIPKLRKRIRFELSVCLLNFRLWFFFIGFFWFKLCSFLIGIFIYNQYFPLMQMIL